MPDSEKQVRWITPQEIRKTARKLWSSGRVLKAELGEAEPFPFSIRFRKPSADELLHEFEAVRAWIGELRSGSKAALGFGYTLEMQRTRNRKLGEQDVPAAIRFETADELARLIRTDRELGKWRDTLREIEQNWPALMPWVRTSPMKLLDKLQDWSKFTAVLAWFRENPNPDRYIRQLDIPGVDTKFIEENKRVIDELLSCIIPPGQCGDPTMQGLDAGFEQRYGLKNDEPLVRFRYLDEEISPLRGVTDIGLTLSDFRRLDTTFHRVFITENKINGLSFPSVSESIVIFGLGFGLGILKEVEWLAAKEIHYWGDIDTHGFAMLSQMRGYFPGVKSLLMDSDTLLGHRLLWVREGAGRRFTGRLEHLTEEEAQLYDDLRKDRIGERVRLEQERIRYGFVLKRLASFR